MSSIPNKAQAIRTTIHWSNQDSAKVGLILTAGHGLALIASKPIFAGEKLMAFDGPQHQAEDGTKRTSQTW